MPYYKHNDINLYYEVAGEGPPLLLINGLSADTRQWEPLTAKLKKTFTIIGYDMRCAGKSDKPEANFTIKDLADEAFGLISHLGLKKVSALGFSMGGFITMEMAIRSPDVMDKLFLVATAPSFKHPYPVPSDIISLLHRTDVSPELLTQVHGSIFGANYRKKVSAKEFIKFRMEDPNPQPAFAYLNQLNACERFDIVNDAGKISNSVAIITGDQDRLIPPDNSRWLKEQMPNSKLFIFKGVGHMVPIEEPEKLANIVVAGAF